MFCYQRSFGLPTEIVTAERFWALVRAPYTSELIDGYRQSGDAALKRKLPAFIFQATFDETVSKKGNKGTWRCQAGSRLNGLCVMDVDHVGSRPTPGPSLNGGECIVKENMGMAPRELYEKWRREIPELFNPSIQGGAGGGSILLVYITPSGHGLKIVFKARLDWGNLIDNQHAMAKVLGVEVDESCKDASRMSFICKESDILYLNEELFTYENEEFGAKYNELYHEGKSQATISLAADNHGLARTKEICESPCESAATENRESPCESAAYNDVPYSKIIEAWLDGVNLDKNRHNTLTELASHLRYLIGKNPKKITEVVMQLPWVQDLAAEGEDVAGTVSSVMGWRYNERMPVKLREALQQAGALEKSTQKEPS